MTKQADEIAALTAKVNALAQQLSPTPMPTEREVAAFRDEMRKIADDRALRDARSFFSRDDLAKMREACPDAQAIVHQHRNAPRGPTAECIIPTSQQVSHVRVGGGTGWQHRIPIRNGIGQGK